MHGSKPRPFLVAIFIFIIHSLFHTCQAEILSDHLDVITSGNPGSNAIQSFVIIKQGKLLKEGIKHSAKQQTISQQSPFVIRYTKPINKALSLQWNIKVIDKQHGTVKILSKFKGNGRMFNSGFKWQSEILNKENKNRTQLIFRPNPFSHQPAVYKKGKGPQGNRRKYGGGTRNIAEKKYNPKFEYRVTLSILDKNNKIETHETILSMDRIDMIRQEYINHYDIKRYGRGKNGNIPIPKREEITKIPKYSKNIAGNPLTESEYELIIDDGIVKIAEKINHVFYNYLSKLKQTKSMKDLNSKKLNIPESKLWMTSGWRNPERNEWYSNAVNGVHQRGGAIDLIIMAPSGSKQSAIGYWILWNALEKDKQNINAYWQLETNGRPMTTKEFKQDIEPKNGIPDAFDKADHLHANVKY